MSVIPTVYISKNYSNQLINYCMSRNITGCEDYYGNMTNNQTEWLYQMSYINVNQTTFMIKKYIIKNNFLNDIKLTSVPDYNFINFLTMVCLFITNCFFLIIINNKVKEADYGQITPSDFTLMIRNIGNDFSSYEELQKKVLEIVK